MDTNFLAALCLSSAGVALSYSVFLRFDVFQKRTAIVISLAFGVLTFLYLQEHPDVLKSTVEKIALSILGGLIALALFVRKKSSG